MFHGTCRRVETNRTTAAIDGQRNPFAQHFHEFGNRYKVATAFFCYLSKAQTIERKKLSLRLDKKTGCRAN